MSDRFFVDTNILVYTRDSSEAQKQERAMAWMTRLWNEQTGRLSFQVLAEFYITVTQKLQPGMEIECAREDIRCLLAWRPLTVDDQVMSEAWRLQGQCQLSWWDALIVSAAHFCGCRYLLTEDLQAGRTYGVVEAINPFQVPSDSI